MRANITGAVDQTTIEVKEILSDIVVGFDQALVRPTKHDTKIFIPETLADKMFSTGTIVKVGRGGHDFAGHHIPPIAKVGDYVLFGMLDRVFKLKLDLGNGPEVLLLIDQDEILGVLTLKDAEVVAKVG